ncbi:MAG TPA: 50S rRNA methyltransferase [Spirochaetia bacterium]|nr:MAG: hypothetical protein A2Y41_11975 [Spirochaetes bacterium GWB1_36_13]HCL58106.1 50S rRNA methyltransferase [Spirochaetia bacterium]
MIKSNYHKPDFFTDKAKKEGYAARSIYKLEEIDKKYQIIKPNAKILDLGAFPGSWSQYALKKVGKNGLVVGIDIQKITLDLGSNYVFFHQSILDPSLDFSSYAPFNAVISDMAPNTTGIKDQDVALSLELSLMAAEAAQKYMKKEGTFICKIFQGEGFDEFYSEIKQYFKKIKSFKPEAVRSQSKEIYLIGWELK